MTTLVLLTGCYKAEFNTTDHPEQAEVTMDVKAPILPNGTIYTGSMTLVINGESYTLEPGESFTIPDLLDPGQYTYYIYSNHPEDGAASVSYDKQSGSLIASVPVDSNGNVDPNPNEIYFGTETIEVSADSAVVLNTETSTLGRDLHFVLDVEGDASSKLVGFSAMLNGVAQQWDCVNDTPYGSSASVLPSLTFVTTPLTSMATRTTEKYHLEGTIHLLGVSINETQMLTIDLTYEGGNPSTHTFESDVTDVLSEFNDDKSTSMTLSNTVETPTSAKPEGSIGDWVTVIVPNELEAK